MRSYQMPVVGRSYKLIVTVLIILLVLRIQSLIGAAYLNQGNKVLLAQLIYEFARRRHTLQTAVLTQPPQFTQARRAIALLQESRNWNPRNGHTFLGLGRAHLVLGEWRAAESAFSKARALSGNAENAYNQGLAFEFAEAPWFPNFLMREYHLARAMAFTEAYRWDEAIAEYRLALLGEGDAGQDELEKGYCLSLRKEYGEDICGNGGRVLSLRGPRYLMMEKNSWAAAPVEITDEWALLGYDLDERVLEAGLPLHVILYWKPLKPATPPSDWVRMGDRWIQIVKVNNIIPDAGFEWSRSAGWAGPGGWYTARANQWQLVRGLTGGRESTFMKLKPTKQGLDSNILSTRWIYHYQRNDRPYVYVWGVWIRSDGGNPHFFVHWETLEGTRLRTDIPVQGNIRGPWRQYSGILWPPVNAARVTVELHNWQSLGTVAFDNIIFFPVEVPTH